MAERIVSPGVFTREVDQSFLPAAIGAIGAAVVGPTVKGPAMVPTIVSGYDEYRQIFGDVFTSGSGASEKSYKYLTSISAQNYLKYADTLTVTRIMAGAYAPADSYVKDAGTSTGVTYASGSVTIVAAAVDNQEYRIVEGSTTYRFIASGNPIPSDDVDGDLYFFSTGSTATATATNLVSEVNGVSGIGVTAVDGGSGLFVLSGSSAGAGNGITFATSSATDATTFATQFTLAGASSTVTAGNSFRLYTLADGAIMNSGQAAASTAGSGSAADETKNNMLVSGSIDNLRWEVANVNNTLGTFSLYIRRGDDTNRKKVSVEQYNNLTLDPNSPNYIARRIGDQKFTLRDAGGTSPFLQLSGSFPIRSKYVRAEVLKTTLNYLDSNGNVRVGAASASLPQAVSGTFANGSDGNVKHPQQFYNGITNTNTQGFNLGVTSEGKSAYTDAINLLSNQDEYDINLLSFPGLLNSAANHGAVLSTAESMVEGRGDCFLVSDPILYGSGLSAAQAQAEAEDSSYNAMYWPWLQIADNDLGQNIWVPATTLIPGVYAFNDMVAAPWFAPAGLNRGGLETVIRAERKLTQTNRDDLYESNVNPIATFPNSGVVVFGQKTLQKKSSALDRINVRRLLIAAKKFVASSSKFLVFEQNTTATRNRFLSIVNPYFEDIQQRQGLYAFKVVMDETNNTPDVVDRNQLVGQIFLQPAKTAEFIIIDFNVLPTGAAFPE